MYLVRIYVASNHQFIFTNPWIFLRKFCVIIFLQNLCFCKTLCKSCPHGQIKYIDIHKSFSSTQYHSPTYYLFWNTRQKSKNESQESATESEEIQPAKNRSFRRSKVSKNQDSDDNTISSNEKKIVRKSPPQIIVHKSQPSEHKQGTLYHYTMPRKKLLCQINWGAGVSMEISSIE